ncbi:MAG: DUF2442 domain-containing protein [Candidatus Riflebacteria bacterium HGW-Riflebacteria-1]|nr:MAG: DUF2442 domain-containing protein [Candidatus Riflebacteria bacterium HGW-Riflebacteria-1]
MSIMANSVKACFENGYIVIQMADGMEIKFPVSHNRRLASGTEEQLNNIEISPYGLHWPELDEDLSFKGLSEGNFGQHAGSNANRCNKKASSR